MEQEGEPRHTYVGELYFSAHRGTYTAQAGIKQNNRASEIALHEMEFIGSLALVSGFHYELDKADRLWKTLLFHQFHDILPGSSIQKVYQQAFTAHQALREEASQITSDAAEYLLSEDGGISFFNSLSFERKALVTLPEQYKDGAVTKEGCFIPVQKLEDGSVLAAVTIPSCGAVSLYPVSGQGTASEEFVPRRDIVWKMNIFLL